MGTVRRWSGSAWQPVKRWSGTRWDPVYAWDGTAWKPSQPGASVVGSTWGLSAPAGVTSIQTAIPAGLQAGDMLYLALFCTDTNAGAPITATATGWTPLTAKADQGTCQRAFYSAPWSAGLAGVTWAVASARRFGYACVAVRNGRTAVLGLTDLAASGAAVPMPSVTATGPGLALRFAVRKDNLSTAITPPAGSATIVSQLGTSGPAPHVGVWSQAQAAAGATNTAQATFTAASANGTGWTLAV